MKFKTNLLAVTLMASAFADVLADTPPVISIINQRVSAPVVIVVSSIYDFEREISVRVRKDPRFIPTEVLIKTVSEYVMTDAKGIVISSGYEIDVEHDLVIGYSGGNAEIIKAAITPQGLQVISNFKDKNGHFVSPPASSIAMYNTSGDKLCFTYGNAQSVAPDISITLLLDRSGSMASTINKVKDAANGFLNLLPPSAQCSVASFNTTWSYGHTHFQVCNGGGFGFENIVASGGTDIYAPLKDAYLTFAKPEFEDHQRAILIITDGYTLEDEARKSELLRLRGDVLTLVYFVGGSGKNQLEGITDHFVADGGDISQSLDQYFQSVSQAYNTQKVLTVQSCGASAP